MARTFWGAVRVRAVAAADTVSRRPAQGSAGAASSWGRPPERHPVISVAAVVAVTVVTVAFLQALRWQARQHARERDLLVNQVLHLSGRTWQPPPADDTPAVKPEPEGDPKEIRPGQWPE